MTAPPPRPPAAPVPRPGLRERKKLRTRFAIQEQAMRLFLEQGYAATTVEQIAEAADISPSTFFRYFPTKDAVAVGDGFDAVFVEALRTVPPGVPAVRAVREAFTTTFGGITDEQVEVLEQRNALVLGTPELRAAFLGTLAEAGQVLAAAFAQRSGRSADDDDVVALAGAVVGVIASALLLGDRDLRGRLDRVAASLAHLETGFDL